MKISTRGRYGARALFDMAYNVGEETLQLKEIAKRQYISQRYLEQIFQDLKTAGLVLSQRGPKGGYRLAKPPEKISIGEILRATDNEIFLVECTKQDGQKHCDMKGNCVTQKHWAMAAAMVQNYFDKVTLADMCKEGDQIGLEKFS